MLGLQHVLFRVVRRPNKRPAFNVAEAHFLADLVQLGKGVWMHELRHRKVLGRGLQLLAQRDDLAIHRTQVLHGLHHFIKRLANGELHAKEDRSQRCYALRLLSRKRSSRLPSW